MVEHAPYIEEDSRGHSGLYSAYQANEGGEGCDGKGM
jgi:hypothetical protein